MSDQHRRQRGQQPPFASDPRMLAHQLFTPSTPIVRRDLLAGRASELDKLATAYAAPGRHAVIYGERGVGKTSLANVFLEALRHVDRPPVALSVTCISGDTFEATMRTVLTEVRVAVPGRERAGFNAPPPGVQALAASNLTTDFSPNSVRVAIDMLHASGKLSHLIVVVDEFEVLEREDRRRFAHAIKLFSDRGTPMTVVLCGVASTVTDLVLDHESITRSLTQVLVPRLSPAERKRTVLDRLPHVGLRIDDLALEYISVASQGFPHLVHQMGLEACLVALEASRDRVSVEDVVEALRHVCAASTKTLTDAHERAIASARRDTLYAKVLAIAALAVVDSNGYFRPRALLEMFKRAHSATASYATYNEHLKELVGRGALESTGEKKNTRYRFGDPLLAAYSLMYGFANGVIDTRVFDSNA